MVDKSLRLAISHIIERFSDDTCFKIYLRANTTLIEVISRGGLLPAYSLYRKGNPRAGLIESRYDSHCIDRTRVKRICIFTLRNILHHQELAAINALMKLLVACLITVY